MKSFVTACWLAVVFLANLLINAPITRLYPLMAPGVYFAMLAGAMVVVVVVFQPIAAAVQPGDGRRPRPREAGGARPARTGTPRRCELVVPRHARDRHCRDQRSIPPASDADVREAGLREDRRAAQSCGRRGGSTPPRGRPSGALRRRATCSSPSGISTLPGSAQNACSSGWRTSSRAHRLARSRGGASVRSVESGEP